MAPFVNLFGPVDAVLAPYADYLVLGLVLINLITRYLAHRRHAAQASAGEESVDRYLPHTASNLLLVLASFYFLSLHQHAGIVLSVLVVGLFITDFFEFESRNVEARNDMPIEWPKAAMGAWFFVFLYAGYQALYWAIAGPWQSVV